MPHLVVTGDVTVGCLIRRDLGHAGLDGFLVLAEGEENGPNIGTLNISQLCPVCLFLGKGILVTLDALLLVVLDRGEADQSELSVIAQALLVDVDARFVVLHEVALLDEVHQVVASLSVDLLGVGVCIVRESDLRLVDVKETHGIALCHLAGLLSVEGVVGGGDNFVAVFLVGEEGLEGADFDHSILR